MCRKFTVTLVPLVMYKQTDRQTDKWKKHNTIINKSCQIRINTGCREGRQNYKKYQLWYKNISLSVSRKHSNVQHICFTCDNVNERETEIILDIFVQELWMLSLFLNHLVFEIIFCPIGLQYFKWILPNKITLVNQHLWSSSKLTVYKNKSKHLAG
jgi:hypothetical protein